MSTYLMHPDRLSACDCGHPSLSPGDHTDSCALFACSACGARVLVEGVEHAEDCADRCPHCGSEGSDNDHRDGCPTLGTCAQFRPHIPRSEGWHFEPPQCRDLSRWIAEHMASAHPKVEQT